MKSIFSSNPYFISPLKIATTICIILSSISPANSQLSDVEKQIQNYFFGLSFYVDIEVLKLELASNPEFKLFLDPNRDSRNSIVGTFARDTNLNPIAASNQLIIHFSGNKNKKISMKWSIHYKHEDFASAIYDFEKLKSTFKPNFNKAHEKNETGQQKEQTSSLTLRSGLKTIIIKLVKYNNFTHTLSLEYQDTWKITPTDIIKVKY